MKKLMKSLMLFAAAAMALTSCENEAMNEGIEQNDTYTLNFVAGAPESKTSVSISGNSANFAWGEDEKFVFVQNTEGQDALTLGTNVTFTNNDGVAEISATFTGDAETEYNHAAVYPAAAWVENSNETYKNVKLYIKDAQTLTEGSFDPDADLMVSKQVTCVATELPNALQFTRLVSIAEMNLKDMNVADGEKILSVAFSVSKSTPALAGRTYVDLSTGIVKEYAYYGETNTITLSNVDGIASDSESTKVYFTCIPATVASGATYTVTVTTDAAKYTKSAQLSKDLVFEVGKVKAFGVNMADAVKEETSSLAGDYIIVAKRTSGNFLYLAPSNNNSSSRIDAVNTGVTAIEDVEMNETYKWTVAKNGNAYTIASSTGKYISYSGSGNTAQLSTTAKDMTITETKTEGVYNIALVSDASRQLQLNNNEAYQYYAFYTSDQIETLYLIPFKVDIRTAQTLSFAEESYELTEGDEFDAPTVEGAMTTVIYTSSKESVATVDASTGEVTIVGTGTTTITATAAANETYKKGSASYTLTVNAVQQGGGESKTYTENFTTWTNNQTSNSSKGTTTGNACSWSWVGASKQYWSNVSASSSLSFAITLLRPSSDDGTYVLSETLSGGIKSLTLTAISNNTSTGVNVYIIDVDKNTTIKVGTLNTTTKKKDFTNTWDLSSYNISGNYQIKIANKNNKAYCCIGGLTWSN